MPKSRKPKILPLIASALLVLVLLPTSTHLPAVFGLVLAGPNPPDVGMGYYWNDVRLVIIVSCMVLSAIVLVWRPHLARIPLLAAAGTLAVDLYIPFGQDDPYFGLMVVYATPPAFAIALALYTSFASTLARR